MVLEEILKEEYNAIEREAGIKKKTVNFVLELVERNYHDLNNAFDSNIKINDNTEKEERLLYYQTKKMLDELEKVSLDVTHYTPYDDFNKPDSPDIKFGMTEYEKFSPEISMYGKKLTGKGKEIINNYRKIRELPSIEEAKSKNSELLNKYL